MRLATLALIPALALVAACDSSKKAPPPAEATGSIPANGQLPAGHPPIGQLPQGHPPMGQMGQMGQMPGGEAPAPFSEDGSAPAGCPVTWEMPGTWTPTPPANLMRIANFTVAEDEGKPIEVVVSGVTISGTAEQNVTRWLRQFQFADADEARAASEITQLESDGLKITRLDVTGTFGGGMGPDDGHAGAADYRMLAVMVEGARTPMFVKLVGPKSVVASQVEAFDAFVRSMSVPQ